MGIYLTILGYTKVIWMGAEGPGDEIKGTVSMGQASTTSPRAQLFPFLILSSTTQKETANSRGHSIILSFLQPSGLPGFLEPAPKPLTSSLPWCPACWPQLAQHAGPPSGTRCSAEHWKPGCILPCESLLQDQFLGELSQGSPSELGTL